MLIYFIEHKLAIEIDEKGHTNRSENEEKERRKLIQNELGCKFAKINPDAKKF